MKHDSTSQRETPVLTRKARVILNPNRRAMPGEKTDEGQPLHPSGKGEEATVQTVEQKQVKRKSGGLNDFTPLQIGGKPLPPLPKPKTLSTPTKSLQPSSQVITNRQPVVIVSPGRDLRLLSKKEIKLVKLLKGDDIKVTCLLDIGGEPYVIKAGAGNGHIADNLDNTDLFRRLKIPGVKAPFAERLTDEFRTALRNRLDSNNPEAKVVLDALGQNDQIATTAPGFAIQDIMASDTHKLKRELLKTIQGKSTEDAVTALSNQLEQQLSVTEIKLSKAAESVKKLRNPTTRAGGIEELKTRLQLPKNKDVLSVIAAVFEQSADIAVGKITAELNDLDAAKDTLGNRVRSEQGAYALGGMGIMDLLCGMDDRILSKWNGGNFLFDPQGKDLWCVDNAKSEHLGFSAKNDDAWEEWVVASMTDQKIDKGQSIVENLHFAIYDSDRDTGDFSQNFTLTDAERATTKTGIKNAVSETISKMQALVDDDHSGLTNELRKKLLSRLKVVNARMTFTDLLTFNDAFLDVPVVKKPGKLEKATRAISGKVKGRDEIQKRAEQIKNDVRDNQRSEKQLLALENELLQMKVPPEDQPQDEAQDPDRRVNKALFEVKLKRLVLYLDDTNTSLEKLSSGEEKPWGTISPDAINKLREGAAPWIETLRTLGDKDEEAALVAALDKLAKTAVSLSAAK